MTGRLAVMAMYPLPSVRSAWDALYEAAAAAVSDAPAHLDWIDPHDAWADSRLELGMACGWPFVTALRGRLRVIGAFAYGWPTDVDEAPPAPHLYRTAVVARDPQPLADLSGATAAINSLDSLSGHISLLDAFGCGASWPGPAVITGAHVASIAAVRRRQADVASIDGMTWAYLRRDEPETTTGIHVVGRGPWVPSLPVVVDASTPEARCAAWRQAIRLALATVGEPVRETLMIDSFVELDDEDYLRALAPALAAHRSPGG